MKQRDLELLSSYLDGQLSSSDSARLEARLISDPSLRSVLDDLRGARSLLRQLPMRKAPRNFTLTPKMVGKNPPLPRAYPVFRFASTLATILLFFTMGLNFIRPQLASAPPAYGRGGGGVEETFAAEAAPAGEQPASEEPSIAMAPMPTEAASTQEDAAGVMETPLTKESETENGVGGGLEDQQPAQAPSEAPIVSPVWQWLLAGVALLSAFTMAVMRQLSINRWRRK